MYITAVPNRNSEPTYLLRESFRDADGKVKNRTLANLSKLLLDDLATLTKNRVQVAGQNDGAEFDMLTTPTEVQAKAFELLGLRL